MCCYGAIGEVVNTADCGPVMRGFDSHIAPHIYKLALVAFLFYVFLIFYIKFSQNINIRVLIFILR